jgi:hypothetical protein
VDARTRWQLRFAAYFRIIPVSQQTTRAIKGHCKRNSLLRHLMFIRLRSKCLSTLMTKPACAESNSVCGQEITKTDQKPLADTHVKEEDTVEETLVQAHDAFEDFISEKLKSYAEQNIAAALEFVSWLNEAKTFQDVIQIQMEFMQMQLQSFGEQAKQFSDIYIQRQGRARLIFPYVFLSWPMVSSGVMADIVPPQTTVVKFPYLC